MLHRAVHAALWDTSVGTCAELMSVPRLTDAVMELLQNARRAAATLVYIETRTDARGSQISIIDNGSGVQAAESLLHFGRSNWDGAAGEEPAHGMGFFKLSGWAKDGPVQVRTRTARMINGYAERWTMTITEGAFRGLKPALLNDDCPWPSKSTGTRVDIRTDQPVKPWALDHLVRYYPLPVVINGQRPPQVGFTTEHEPDYIETVNGNMIAVYNAGRLDEPSGASWNGTVCEVPIRDDRRTPTVRIELRSHGPIRPRNRNIYELEPGDVLDTLVDRAEKLRRSQSNLSHQAEATATA